jgi:hypothetical protein
MPRRLTPKRDSAARHEVAPAGETIRSAVAAWRTARRVVGGWRRAYAAPVSLPPDVDSSRLTLVVVARQYLASDGSADMHAIYPNELPNPDPVDGFIPAVTVRSYGVYVIADALTPTDFDTGAAAPRVRAFARDDGNGSRVPLHLFVYNEDEPRAKAAIDAAGFAPDDELIQVHTVGRP